MDGYRGKERRTFPQITSEQLDAIAERAAEKALEQIYSEIGRGVLKKLAWASGLILVSLLVWLAKIGKLAF